MHILVTGASGFIGRHLCDFLLSSGNEVTRSVRRHDDQPNTLIMHETTPKSDMLKNLTGIDCIVHLAGIAHVYSKIDPLTASLYQGVNLDFTRRLAEAARDAGVKRFVFVSTIKVSGEESGQRPLNETDPGDLADQYSKSKWNAERALLLIESESNLEIVIVRPPLVYGPGVRANFGMLMFAARKRIPLPFGNLDNKRSLLYVKNLTSALLLCATLPEAAGETFTLSDSSSFTLPELFAEISLVMGNESRIFSMPKWLLFFFGFIFRRRQQVSSLTKSLEVDSSKIRKILGWVPIYDLHTGIKETVDWYMLEMVPRGKVKDAQVLENRPLKVCQLCAVDFTLLHLLLPLIDGMQARGWQVISVCSEGSYAMKLRESGYQHDAISVSRNIFDLPAHLFAMFKLFKLFRKERFDLLHVHTPIAATIGRIAGRLAGVPLIIYTAHGFYFHDQMPKLQYRFFVRIERWSKFFTDFLFTQSSEDAQTAIVEGIATKSSVVAIGNGVSVEKFFLDSSEKIRVLSEFKVSKGSFVIGVIARLVREKGLVEFLSAAIEIGVRYPQSCFLLVGERLRSDHNASIDRELVKAQQLLGDRLIVTGYRSDVRSMLSAMDLFCLPSYREGMPRSIIEAMMMELPVVATNIRGAREEVVPGVTGLLVPTRSVSALVDAFASLINDLELARRMGKAGRQRALELYDEKQVVDRQLEIIDSLVSKNLK